jgi:hypothetical protein
MNPEAQIYLNKILALDPNDVTESYTPSYELPARISLRNSASSSAFLKPSFTRNKPSKTSPREGLK